MDINSVVIVSRSKSASLWEISKFFSQFGVVDQAFEDKQNDEIYIVFQNKRAAQAAIEFDGESFQDCVLHIRSPSEDEFKLVQHPRIGEGDVQPIRSPSEDEFKLVQNPRIGEGDVQPPTTSLKILHSQFSQALKQFTSSEMLTFVQNLMLEMKDDLKVDQHVSPIDVIEESKHILSPPILNTPVEASSPSLVLPKNFKTLQSTSDGMNEYISRYSHPPNNAPAQISVQPTPGVGYQFSQHPTQVAIPSLQYPKITFCSGESKDASFNQWRNEVKCLLNEGHPISNIMQGIRRSLKGTAADVLINLGEHANPISVLHKFEIVFGETESSEALFEKYYTARQTSEETIAQWGCRLEGILVKLQTYGVVVVNIPEMLRTKFWSGMFHAYIKSALRHKFDSGICYESLLSYARSVEQLGDVHRQTHIHINPS